MSSKTFKEGSKGYWVLALLLMVGSGSGLLGVSSQPPKPVGFQTPTTTAGQTALELCEEASVASQSAKKDAAAKAKAAAKGERLDVRFLKAPAHLNLAYHKNQTANLPEELAMELISTNYAVLEAEASTETTED